MSETPEDRPAWETEIERTGNGDEVLRHEAGDRPFEMATGDEELIEAVERHLAEHVGGEMTVFHELVSDLVHLDVHVCGPTAARPFYTLMTSGMAERRMAVPEQVDAEAFGYAELMICLPPDWPGLGEAHAVAPAEDGPFADEANYWPIRLLKFLARLPHEYETWLGFGHSIPNGDPARPWDESVGFTGVVLLPPVHGPEEKLEGLRAFKAGERVVNVYAVVPVYDEEMAAKLEGGVEALFPGFDRQGVNEVLDVDRPVTVGGGGARRGWWPFGR